MPDDFFGDTGWDGSLDDIEPAAAEPEAEPAVEAEAAVEAEPESAPEAETPAAEERERDSAGRFLPKKIEVDDPEVAAFLAKYGDDPVKALKAATEAQRTLGSMGNELGQLRQQVEQIANRPEPKPQLPATQITQELIDQNPAAATQLAFEQDNQVALQIAFESWKLDDPASAATWVMTKQMEERDRQWQEKLAAVESRIAPVQAAQEQTAFAQALREIQTSDPEVLTRIQQNLHEVPQETQDALSQLIQNGTPVEQIGAFKALAALTRGREAPATLDVQALAREQALAADEAIAEAAVVSAASSKSEPAKTMADQIGDEWVALERPLADGWNIG